MTSEELKLKLILLEFTCENTEYESENLTISKYTLEGIRINQASLTGKWYIPISSTNSSRTRISHGLTPQEIYTYILKELGIEHGESNSTS
jgi:hypothetical protein